MIDEPGSPPPFPWREVMAFGLGRLRLPPRDFWAMTPREIAAALEAGSPGFGSVPRRPQLESLMAMFPDIPEKDKGR